MADPFEPLAFASDEDLVVEAESDWPLIVPDSQKLATGSDGLITSMNPWVLNSASVDFGARSVVAGQVVNLKGDLGTSAETAFGPNGQLFVVESVSGHAVTLRQPGMDADEGEAPGIGVDLFNVFFDISTARRQIQTASRWIKRRLNFDGLADLVTADDLTELTWPRALAKLFRSQSRNKDDEYATEADKYDAIAEQNYQEVAGRRWAKSATDHFSIVPVDTPTGFGL